MFYLWLSWRFYDGALIYPSGAGDLSTFFDWDRYTRRVPYVFIPGVI